MNLNFDKVMRCVNFLISASSLVQSKYLHDDEVQLQQKLTMDSINKARQLHHESIKLNKKTYLVDMFLSLEQHFQQLNADLLGSSRESTRDMFDQRNQQLQTIILSSSVMFSALSTVIIQGPLNTEASQFLVITYSLVCSLSFASLFITIVVCIEIVMRASKFMYKKSESEINNLRRAIENTRYIIDMIRKKTFNDDSSGKQPLSNMSTKNGNLNRNKFVRAQFNKFQNSDDETDMSPKADFCSDQKLVEIVKMSDEEIRDLWEQHERSIHKFLQIREKTIGYEVESPKRMRPQIQQQDGDRNRMFVNSQPKLFDSYWSERCQSWSDFATLTFYIGTSNLLLAAMIFMWSEYDLTYLSEGAGILAVIIIGVSLIVGITLGISLRFDYFTKSNQRSGSRKDPNLPTQAEQYSIDSGIYVKMKDELHERNSMTY